MYEEIFELINKGEINKAQEQIGKISESALLKQTLGPINLGRNAVPRNNRGIRK